MSEDSPQPNLPSLDLEPGFSLHFWVLALLTGAGAGVAGGLLMKLLHLVQHVSWSYAAGEFVDAVHHASNERRVAILAAAGLLVAAASRLLSPRGKGHGGEIAAAIWFRAGRLPPLATTARAIVSIAIVGMGASLGREAAPKQAGGLVADMLADWTALPDGQRRLLVACGAGAGIAAVYNVPFGGALFALEVLLGTLSLPLVAPALATSVVATVVSQLFLPDQPTYAVPALGITPGQLLWALLFGPVAGLISVGWIRLISRADAHKPKGWLLLISPIIVLSLLGIAAIGFPELLGNGKDLVQELFLAKTGLPLLAILLVLRPLATAACLGGGAPGGLFTPTMTIGALLGGTLGDAWKYIWPGGTPGTYAFVGAGAVLAGAMQAPVSAVVLLLELTRRLDSSLLAVILAVFGAAITTRLLEPRSVYSARIHAGRALAKQKEAGGVVSSATRYAELLHRLLKRGDETTPLLVMDESGKVVGCVSRRKVISPSRSAAPLETATAADFLKRREDET
ncbi:MAG: chloride channel protein [Rhizomicrobium sp.]